MWKEIQSGCVDENLRLQDAVNAQVDIDRIVCKLTELNEELWNDKVNYGCECQICHSFWSYFQNETERFVFCPHCGSKNEVRGDKE